MPEPNPVTGLPGTQERLPWRGMRAAVFGGAVSWSFYSETEAECRRKGLSGDRDIVPDGSFGSSGREDGRSSDGQAQFAMGTLAAKALGQFAFLAGASGERQGTQGLGGGKIERGAELGCGMAQKAALQSGCERDKPCDINCEAIGGGAASSADGTAGQDQLRPHAGQLGLPPGFFVARQIGHLRQVLPQPRVPGFEQGQQFVADTVAGEGEMAVG